MNTKAVQAYAEATVVVGCSVLLLGLFYMMVANVSALCGVPLQSPGTPSYSCVWNLTPLILPAIVGGALIVAGVWTFWAFKPRAAIKSPAQM